MPPTFDILIKTILVGDSETGKTSFVDRLTRNTFNDISPLTIGIDFSIKSYDFSQDTGSYINKVKICLWDTAGQERYHSIVESYFRNVNFVMLFYSLIDSESLDKIPDWMQCIQKQCPKLLKTSPIPLYLVGNKSDLSEKRKITPQQGVEMAEQYRIPCAEISVKDNKNLSQLVAYIVNDLVSCLNHYFYTKRMETLSAEQTAQVLTSSEFQDRFGHRCQVILVQPIPDPVRKRCC